jgi:hypothetical protein
MAVNYKEAEEFLAKDLRLRTLPVSPWPESMAGP